MRTEFDTVGAGAEHDAASGTGEEAVAPAQGMEAEAQPRVSPGRILREQREAAGLALPEVAEALHLTVHYVKALENDDFAKLPGLTFVKGYCRAYARHLGMDVQLVLAAYEEHLQQREDLVAQEAQDFRSRHRNDQAVIWALVAGAVLVVALVAGWWWFGRDAGDGRAAIAVPAYDASVQASLQVVG